MNCREFVDFLMDYLDGQLPEKVRATFEQHLVDCPPCEVYLETYAETIRLGKAALCSEGAEGSEGSEGKGACEAGRPRVSIDGGPPEPVPEGLIRAILAARQQR